MTHALPSAASVGTASRSVRARSFDPLARAFLGRTSVVEELRSDLRELATASLTLALIRAADALDAR